jgi:O-antigen/teichoic acid export membrane protein
MSFIDWRLPPQIGILKDNLANSPIAYRLAHGAFWSLLGGVASRIFTVFSSIIVARMIGRNGYGEFGMVQSTMGMFGVLAGFGLGTTATKYISEFRFIAPERSERISNLTIIISLANGLFLVFACLFGAGLLSSYAFDSPYMADYLRAGSLLLVLSALNGVLLGILAGFEAFRSIARINIWQGVSAPLCAIPLVWLYGVHGAVASLTVNASIGLWMCANSLRRLYIQHSFKAGFSIQSFSEWPVLYKYSLPSMLSSLMVVPVTWLTNLFLIRHPDGFGELGLFNAANQWRTIIMFLPGLLTSAMLPVMSDIHGRENRSDFVRIMKLNLQATWVVSLPLTIIVIEFGGVLAGFFGRDFRGSASATVLMSVVCFLMVVNNTVGTALAGTGRMWVGTTLNFLWGIALVITSYLLIPVRGAFGLAIAYVIAYLLHTVFQMVYVEIKLAPTSVLSQWKLILFSVMLIGLSVQMALIEHHGCLYPGILLVLSVLPAIQFIKRAMLFRTY